MRCEQVRNTLLEQTLEGRLLPGSEVAEHLDRCRDCQDLVARLALVDMALRSLPVEPMPAWSVRQMLARTAAGRRPEPFLPWTLWLPVGSLLAGLLWAYFTLIWPAGSEAVGSFAPTFSDWLARFEAWIVTQQTMLNAVALALGAGLLFTLLAVSLGLYVGRDRVATRHGH